MNGCPVGTIRTRGLFGCPYVYRGNGVWAVASILEYAEMFPVDRVPGTVTEIVYGDPVKKQ